MDVFNQVKQAANDFDTYQKGLVTAENEIKAVINAVEERIRKDKAEHEEKVAILTAQSQDPARPAILRNLAKKELEQIQGRTFGPSKDETDAFNAAMGEAYAALREVGKTTTRLQELLETATKELRAIKDRTYLNCDPLLSKRALETKQQSFNSLSESIEPLADRLERMRKEKCGPISCGAQYERL